jgi:hypothetical protein
LFHPYRRFRSINAPEREEILKFLRHDPAEKLFIRELKGERHPEALGGRAWFLDRH